MALVILVNFLKNGLIILGSLGCNFWTCINDLPDYNVITLYRKIGHVSGLWQQFELASDLESKIRDTLDKCRNWLKNFTRLDNFFTQVVLVILM